MRKGALPQGEGLFLFFLPHPSSPARIFSKITPVPSLPLKRGATSPSAPSPQERAPTGKPAVLYSQTSFNCVDSRLHSAEHSNEFDALLSLAREFAHKGLLVVIDAIELRLFYARCAIVCAPWARGRKGEGSDDRLLIIHSLPIFQRCSSS